MPLRPHETTGYNCRHALLTVVPMSPPVPSSIPSANDAQVSQVPYKYDKHRRHVNRAPNHHYLSLLTKTPLVIHIMKARSVLPMPY